jgi:hypothetical protein
MALTMMPVMPRVSLSGAQKNNMDINDDETTFKMIKVMIITTTLTSKATCQWK